MDIFIFFSLFSIFVKLEAFDTNCPSVNCGHGTPDIHFPFRVQSQQPQHCGHAGFELFCKQNQTMIHFPSYGDLILKSISYDNKKLNLLDPRSCVHEVFLNLNLSLTPFTYFYNLKKYTYLNCSNELSASFLQVPCLSGYDYHVYVVESLLTAPPPASCKPVKTVAIPFSYSPYLSDNSFGLGLTWDLNGTGFIANDKAILGIIAFIIMVAALICMKIYHSKKKENQNKYEVEKSLGDYETL